jgi:hypothetical protein
MATTLQHMLKTKKQGPKTRSKIRKEKMPPDGIVA